MFYNANLYKVGLMNSQRHGGQRSTSVTFSTAEIPGAVSHGVKERAHPAWTSVDKRVRQSCQNNFIGYTFLKFYCI